jgi:hypothetical protein
MNRGIIMDAATGEPVTESERSRLWIIAAISYLESAKAWSETSRRNRKSKVDYYLSSASDAIALARKEPGA